MSPTPLPVSLTPDEVAALTRRGLRLAQVSIVYIVAEGSIAVAAGAAAGLVSLVRPMSA